MAERSGGKYGWLLALLAIVLVAVCTLVGNCLGKAG